MELKVFAIYDKKSEAFNTPFFMLTKAEAIRSFKNLVHDAQTIISKNPHDFQLFYLGVFTNHDGKIESTVEDMGTAASYKVDQHNVETLYPSEEIAQ